MRNVQKGNYRKENRHLFKKVGSAFVHVYQNPSCKTISELIIAYERHCEEDFRNGDTDAYCV